MSKFLRDKFGLTQDRLASWLGIGRVAVAQAEGGQRGLPLGTGTQDARLMLAAYGKVLDAAAPDGSRPAPPPTPPLAPATKALVYRARTCRFHAHQVQQQLDGLQVQAAQLGAAGGSARPARVH